MNNKKVTKNLIVCKCLEQWYEQVMMTQYSPNSRTCAVMVPGTLVPRVMLFGTAILFGTL